MKIWSFVDLMNMRQTTRGDSLFACVRVPIGSNRCLFVYLCGCACIGNLDNITSTTLKPLVFIKPCATENNANWMQRRRS